MHKNHKRQLSIKIGRDRQQIEDLISQFNQQLLINSPNNLSERLPILNLERVKQRSDRFASERNKYQHNLHTIICQIKNKIDNPSSYGFKYTPNKRNQQKQSPIRLLNKTQFKIKSIKLSTQQKHKKQLSKSYLESPQKKISDEKRKKLSRYQKFAFQPWGTIQEVQAAQTIYL